jgi:methionine-rich copper-binding protein CopC
VQDRLERRVHVLDALLPVLAADEHVGHARLQRARPVERESRDQVLEAVGLEAREELAHALGLELEHAQGLAAVQERVRRLVVERQPVEVGRRPAGTRDRRSVLSRIVSVRSPR